MERVLVGQDWCEEKAVSWVQKLHTRLDRVKEYPAMSRAFVPFLEAVAKQRSDVEIDTTVCLVVGTDLLRFSQRCEENDMLTILRKCQQSTQDAYTHAYKRAETCWKIYKDSLLRLKPFLGNKGVQGIYLKLIHRAIARNAASELVRALELEQALRANMTTVSVSHGSVAKQTAVKKVKYFLNSWKSQFSRHSNRFSTSLSTGNPYFETFRRMVAIDTHDVVNKLFAHSFEKCNITKFSVNIDVGVDLRTLLGFIPKVKHLAASRNKDISTPAKRLVVVVRDHSAKGKHEITIRKGMPIQQLTEANELGLALGCFKSSFPFKEIKAGFFPVVCVKSESRHVPKNSSRRC
ncbi:hypothetical protein CHS0354_013715 [Potamilus streckersoni]|uniref:Uncharacterized protein n=1 Tax=Potamilus streckersoni TaxID=2493646 RepID=A0AAE0WBI1_9BIVA|nr:hypothetical protein CHS0354_013715 [Potamilus streckersoni]